MKNPASIPTSAARIKRFLVLAAAILVIPASCLQNLAAQDKPEDTDKSHVVAKYDYDANDPDGTKSTVTVDFPSSMVSFQSLGTTTDSSVLLISPALKGTYVWKTQLELDFTPADPVLGQEYTFTLAPGSKYLSGDPLPVDSWSHKETLARSLPRSTCRE